MLLVTAGNAAEVITRRWKAAVVRRRYRRIQAAALTMQKHWRGVLERRLVAKARTGIPKLKATFLSKRATARYQEMRRAATVLSRYACRSVALSVGGLVSQLPELGLRVCGGIGEGESVRHPRRRRIHTRAHAHARTHAHPITPTRTRHKGVMGVVTPVFAHF